jgi:hypothetical protein
VVNTVGIHSAWFALNNDVHYIKEKGDDVMRITSLNFARAFAGAAIAANVWAAATEPGCKGSKPPIQEKNCLGPRPEKPKGITAEDLSAMCSALFSDCKQDLTWDVGVTTQNMSDKELKCRLYSLSTKGKAGSMEAAMVHIQKELNDLSKMALTEESVVSIRAAIDKSIETLDGYLASSSNEDEPDLFNEPSNKKQIKRGIEIVIDSLNQLKTEPDETLTRQLLGLNDKK